MLDVIRIRFCAWEKIPATTLHDMSDPSTKDGVATLWLTASTNRWSTVIPNTARSNRGDIRRCLDPTVNPSMGYVGCRTLYEGLRRGATLNPLGPCLGFRAVSTTGFATPYIYSSYTEIVARVDCVAAGLAALSLVPENNPTDRLRLIGLYLPNCMEWVIAEHAIYALGGATVPFYDTCKLPQKYLTFG
jgi:long-chain acyl-CoA synthetase